MFAALAAVPASAAAAVPHVVQPGETLWSIAAANNLTTRTVAAFNGMSENGQVVLGSTVMVPTVAEGAAALQRAGIVPAASAQGGTATAPAAPAAPPAPAPQGAYTVRPGDTLSGIALRYGLDQASLARANGLAHPDALRAGQRLRLAGRLPAPGDAGASVVARRPPTYTVQLGDTLSGIAQQYHLKEATLAQLNGLRDPNRLRAGRSLRLGN
jgi:LysM repeat protein